MSKAMRWPGELGYKAPRLRTIGDVAEIWMTDPGPVVAEYVRTFELTSSDARALREVVRRCDRVPGERVEDVPLARRPISPRRNKI